MLTLHEQIQERKALDVAITESVMDEQISTAERGALFMDEHFPGWYKRINLKTFQIADGSKCVLGQRFGRAAKSRGYDEGYGYALQMLDDKFGIIDDSDLGFSLPDETGWDSDQRSREWDALQVEWVRLISDRKEAAKRHVPV